MMGRKLRFCVAVLALLMLVVAAPTETEAAKKKKKKAAKPVQQTSQAVNPVGYYKRQGGEGPGEIKIKWADKEKTSLIVDAWGGYYAGVEPNVHVNSDSFEGKGKLQGNRAVFIDDMDRRLLIVFQGNRLQVDSGLKDDFQGTLERIYGSYVRQKQKTKRK